jgi:antitoxin component YwqK of YwqJK toxin-antitoxin module
MTHRQSLTIIATLIVILTSCSSKKNREEKYDSGNPKLKYEVVEKKDGSFFKDGYYKEWFENGQIETTGTYSDNKETGNWQWFYKTGQLLREGTYKNGLKDGIWKEFEENGQIASEFQYAAGDLDGLQKSWYPNGQKKCEQNFQKGKANGLMIVWNNDGNKKGEYKYEFGKNLTIIGKYYMTWKSDTAMKKDLIWTFEADNIAKRWYDPKPEESKIFKSPYELLNCSIDGNLENILISLGPEQSDKYEILFGNGNELHLKDGDDPEGKNIRRLIRIKE